MRARKRFGQHFLESAWVARLVGALSPGPTDVFLEIGSGTGALTRLLADRVARVIGVEIDRDLAARLAATAPPNVEIVAADVLGLDLRQIRLGAAPAGPAGADPWTLRVVGNLPYNISSPILFQLLDANEGGPVWSDATLMVQQEVADRLVARPGSRTYGVLAILVGVRARVTELFSLPPGAFRPMPRVTSAVVRLVAHPPPPDLDVRAFDRFVRQLFLHRRKTLLNALAAGWPGGKPGAAEAVAKVGLDPTRRPETLDLSELRRLLEIRPSPAG